MISYTNKVANYIYMSDPFYLSKKLSLRNMSNRKKSLFIFIETYKDNQNNKNRS